MHEFDLIASTNKTIKPEKKKDQYKVVMSVMDSNLRGLFSEVFMKTRYYELGLEFYEICQEVLSENRNKIEDWKYDRFQEYLITLRLNMLDYLNEWDEYISFTHWALDYIHIPYRLNQVYPIHERYIFGNESNQQLHFLYRETTRYNIIKKKIERRNAGKTVDYLLRHQQDRLSYEQIENRYKTVVDFFKSFYHIK